MVQCYNENNRPQCTEDSLRHCPKQIEQFRRGRAVKESHLEPMHITTHCMKISRAVWDTNIVQLQHDAWESKGV